MSDMLTSDGNVKTVDLEIGMPLTGRNNLAETPLLKLVGDIRWGHVAELSGVNSKDIVDEEGNRLYATFFYVGMHFPREAPMSSFGENDQLTIVNTISSCTKESMLDGYHFLYPGGWPQERKVPLRNGRQSKELGVPYVRTSNTFVRMVKGASWLKKAQPAHSTMERLPQGDQALETYDRILGANDTGRFWSPGPEFVKLTSGKLKVDYQPHPDRDLNGVGLLYFANYPMILDVAEREALSEHALLKLPHDLLDMRTLVSRQSAYLSNIVHSDSIEVYLEAWIENPLGMSLWTDEPRPIRLVLNYEMFRVSDRRKMLVSTAEKIIDGTSLEQADLLSEVAALPRGGA